MICWSRISDQHAHLLTPGRAVRRPHRHGRSSPRLAVTLEELWLHLFPYFCFSFRRSSAPTVQALPIPKQRCPLGRPLQEAALVPTRDKAKMGILLPAGRLFCVTLIFQTFS